LASFSGRSMFDRAEFGGRASFGQATFSAPGSFEAARFHDDASFLDATISGGLPGGDAGISFSHTVADKELDLSGSTFISNTNLARLTDGQFVFGADLSELHAGQLRFDSATLQPGIRLRTQGLSVPDLRSKLSDFSHLSGPEEEAHIAGMVEGSAKTRGDLAIANDAHYKLRLLEARQETWPVYVLDFVFYRGVTGYFVRPLRPLLVLLALAVVIAVVAQLHRTRARQVRAWRARVLPWLASLANELLERLSLILPQFGARSSAPPTTGERIEAFTYRVLLVCALIGFANSNPTLRQMLDALR